MFPDETGFGRINKPKYCWCYKGLRATVPCHHIREYRYAYGAVEPLTGESFFLIMPYCNTDCMNVFLQELGRAYPDDLILLVCDGAAWHKAKALEIPNNIRLLFLPPATPEMNTIEQIWKEIRKRGFRNEIFKTLDHVIDRLCETICSLSHCTIQSITGRDWVLSLFNRCLVLDDDSLGYCVHCYNAVFIDNKWIKIDARGNTNGRNAQFSLTQPQLAFTNRSEYDEFFWEGIYANPHSNTMKMLEKADSLQYVIDNIPDCVTEAPDLVE